LRKRLVFSACLGLFVLQALLSTAAAEQPVIFLVRHAEKGLSDGKDPQLSIAGQARAVVLAAVLKDAGITAIYTTEFKRTQQTAAPLAAALGLTPAVIPSSATAVLIDKLKNAPGNVLVVGHGNTIPEVVKGLGLSDPVKIEENDYSNFLVVIPGAAPCLLRLHLP
jgi:phosphohistidine phosphatase SixA